MRGDEAFKGANSSGQGTAGELEMNTPKFRAQEKDPGSLGSKTEGLVHSSVIIAEDTVLCIVQLLR